MRACKMAKERAVPGDVAQRRPGPARPHRRPDQDGFPAATCSATTSTAASRWSSTSTTRSAQGGGAQTDQRRPGLLRLHLHDRRRHPRRRDPRGRSTRALCSGGGSCRTRAGPARSAAARRSSRASRSSTRTGWPARASTPAPRSRPVASEAAIRPGAAPIYPIERTNLAELIAAGRLPLKETLTGDQINVRSKVSHMVVNRTDVQVWQSGGGGGVGDPLLRDPALVARGRAQRLRDREPRAERVRRRPGRERQRSTRAPRRSGAQPCARSGSEALRPGSCASRRRREPR